MKLKLFVPLAFCIGLATLASGQFSVPSVHADPVLLAGLALAESPKGQYVLTEVSDDTSYTPLWHKSRAVVYPHDCGAPVSLPYIRGFEASGVSAGMSSVCLSGIAYVPLPGGAYRNTLRAVCMSYSGGVLWDSTYALSSSSFVSNASIVQKGAAQYVLSGVTTATQTHPLLMKLDGATGVSVFSHQYGLGVFSSDQSQILSADPDGLVFYINAMSDSAAAASYVYDVHMVVKVDTNGVVLWNHSIPEMILSHGVVRQSVMVATANGSYMLSLASGAVVHATIGCDYYPLICGLDTAQYCKIYAQTEAGVTRTDLHRAHGLISTPADSLENASLSYYPAACLATENGCVVSGSQVTSSGVHHSFVVQYRFNATGITNPVHESVVRCVPNPATTYISFTHADGRTCEVYDMRGVRVLSAVLDATTHVSVSDFPVGTYIYRLDDGTTGTFVKQ